MTISDGAEVLVFGAGVAGSTLSRLLAEKGYELLLVDRLPEKRIGLKVCGNAVPEKYFRRAEIPRPRKGEFESRVAGVKIHSPDLETVFTIRDEGYVVNRLKFGQRLLKESLDTGTRLIDRTLAVSPVIEGSRVTGASVRDVKGNRAGVLSGKIVIDATGFVSRLRRMLPASWWVAERMGREESYSCYREIRLLKDDMDDPEYCHIFLSNRIAPLGYYWVFPQGSRKVNVGTGVHTSLRKNPQAIFDRHISELPILKGSIVLDRGVGLVPNRRPLGSMVWNGFACIGDAGYQVNPLAGEGIGPSIHAAKILSDVLFEAEPGDYTLESLWGFNPLYMKIYGARFSALHTFFRMMGSFSDEEISYTMASGLMSERHLQSLQEGSLVSKARTSVRFLLSAVSGRFSLLRRLKSLADAIEKVSELYASYPSSPAGYLDWKRSDMTFGDELESMCARLSKTAVA